MRPFRLAAAFLALATILAPDRPASAKPPTLTALFPGGAERGRSLTVKMSGSFDHWPAKVLVEGTGVWAEPAEEKGVLSILVTEDARPGVRWIRVYDQDGATSLRPFIVGTLPEKAEEEPNNDPRKPQAIAEARVTVNGRLGKRGDVDGFSVVLKAGEVLTADVEAARRLGSPMDAVLQVVSADGFVLEQNDDESGFDPRIVFRAPAEGTYIVRLFAFPATPDSSIHFSGGDAYIYRLTLTTGGFLDHAFPLAVPADGAEVAAAGPNVSSVGLVAPPGAGTDRVALTHPALAGEAEVLRAAGPVVVESEPATEGEVQEIPDLASVSGRIDPPGDRDGYRIALKKGETRLFRLESRSFGLPLDAVLAVLNAEGKSLAEDDDSRGSKDPALKFTPEADGEYRVVVRDLHARGGPRFAYLLTVIRPAPDFALTLASELFDVTPGKETKVAVTVARRDGFAGEIEIRAEDLPVGVEAAAVVSKPGDDSAKSATLVINGSAEAPPGAFRVVGRVVGGEPAERVAKAKIAGLEVETDRPWLTVLPAAKP